MTIQEFEEWFKKTSDKFAEDNGLVSGLFITYENGEFYLLPVEEPDDPLVSGRSLSELAEVWDADLMLEGK